MLTLSNLNRYKKLKKARKVKLYLLQRECYYCFISKLLQVHRYFAFFLNYNSTVFESYCKVNNLQFHFLNSYMYKRLKLPFSCGNYYIVMTNNIKNYLTAILFFTLNLNLSGFYFGLYDRCFSLHQLLHINNKLKLWDFSEKKGLSNLVLFIFNKMIYLIIFLKKSLIKNLKFYQLLGKKLHKRTSY